LNKFDTAAVLAETPGTQSKVNLDRCISYEHMLAPRALCLSEITGFKPVAPAYVDDRKSDRICDIRSRPLPVCYHWIHAGVFCSVATVADEEDGL
jgi:hypothetical protein